MFKFRNKAILDGISSVFVHISTYVPALDKVLKVSGRLRTQYVIEPDLRRQYKIRVDLRRQYNITEDIKGVEE